MFTKRKLFIEFTTGELVPFRPYLVFRHFNDRFELIEIRILKNGFIDVQHEFWTVNQFEDAVRDDRISTQIFNGEHLSIPDMCGCHVESVISFVGADELLKEVRDIIRELNGEPSTSDLCRAAYRRYLESRSEENRLSLKAAYEAIPKHLDCWLLGFEEKDIPIRKAIYGDRWKEH